MPKLSFIQRTKTNNDFQIIQEAIVELIKDPVEPISYNLTTNDCIRFISQPTNKIVIAKILGFQYSGDTITGIEYLPYRVEQNRWASYVIPPRVITEPIIINSIEKIECPSISGGKRKITMKRKINKRKTRKARKY